MTTTIPTVESVEAARLSFQDAVECLGDFLSSPDMDFNKFRALLLDADACGKRLVDRLDTLADINPDLDCCKLWIAQREEFREVLESRFELVAMAVRLYQRKDF